MSLPLVSHPAYQAPLDLGHRFPMGKYGRLAALLVGRGLVPDGYVVPEEAPADIVALAHDPAYVRAIFACDVSLAIAREIGLPVDAGVVRRSRLSTAGTLLAARLALRYGLSGSTAGGSHHARRETGAGFCVFNDVAIAAKALRHEGAIRTALVVDVDVLVAVIGGGYSADIEAVAARHAIVFETMAAVAAQESRMPRAARA